MQTPLARSVGDHGAAVRDNDPPCRLAPDRVAIPIHPCEAHLVTTGLHGQRPRAGGPDTPSHRLMVLTQAREAQHGFSPCGEGGIERPHSSAPTVWMAVSVA